MESFTLKEDSKLVMPIHGFRKIPDNKATYRILQRSFPL
jgi:hypothetical protein